ncbi:hypothetical protein BH708_03935 [Brachybacterium sp. P6-10-X1]|uniref:hypothetical protein n=1 Tax=Brachybacterium sp. P6-10-X1 TaxID=1903186 RepID=UPI0009717FA0|nr:hypothetical protein [Brachybacterium sp. P6-10-X1]APX32019.1 hypothetical protein BH708_03935 [Brachybacterium sp. P6-10-X1]
MTRKVDFIRYLTTQIRRDLADKVRVAIGDPQVAPRIRRVARALPAGASLESIIDRYNLVHSRDRISTTRAIRALTAAAAIEWTALRDVFEVRDAYPIPEHPDIRQLIEHGRRAHTARGELLQLIADGILTPWEGPVAAATAGEKAPLRLTLDQLVTAGPGIGQARARDITAQVVHVLGTTEAHTTMGASLSAISWTSGLEARGCWRCWTPSSPTD